VADLAARESAAAWELRAAWAAQREVVLALDHPAAFPRIQGYVENVSASGAYAVIRDAAGACHVPLTLVLSVRTPHFTEATDLPAGAIPPPPVQQWVPDGQLSLDLTGQPELG
jgi:hypothetical protein